MKHSYAYIRRIRRIRLVVGRMAWNLRDFGGKKIMYYGKRAHVRPLSALNRDEARDCPVV